MIKIAKNVTLLYVSVRFCHRKKKYIFVLHMVTLNFGLGNTKFQVDNKIKLFMHVENLG